MLNAEITEIKCGDQSSTWECGYFVIIHAMWLMKEFPNKPLELENEGRIFSYIAFVLNRKIQVHLMICIFLLFITIFV